MRSWLFLITSKRLARRPCPHMVKVVECAPYWPLVTNLVRMICISNFHYCRVWHSRGLLVFTWHLSSELVPSACQKFTTISCAKLFGTQTVLQIHDVDTSRLEASSMVFFLSAARSRRVVFSSSVSDASSCSTCLTISALVSDRVYV